jgi:6-phosphofructokinase
MGVSAVERLLAGESSVMVALQGRDIVPVSLEEVTTKQRDIGDGYFQMAYVLSR